MGLNPEKPVERKNNNENGAELTGHYFHMII
jgi:hypothetical protein